MDIRIKRKRKVKIRGGIMKQRFARIDQKKINFAFKECGYYKDNEDGN